MKVCILSGELEEKHLLIVKYFLEFVEEVIPDAGTDFSA